MFRDAFGPYPMAARASNRVWVCNAVDKIGPMTHPSANRAPDTDEEYRAIEAALLETARGRWFLAEHGRRARRLDSAMLEDAIGRLQTSLRQPPALLDQLQHELQDLKTQISSFREQMTARPSGPLPTPTAEEGAASRMILQTAEDLHEVAWSLQANPFDPKGCEQIARNAARLYTLSQDQAAHAGRTLAVVEALESAIGRINAVLDTVKYERAVDGGEAAE